MRHALGVLALVLLMAGHAAAQMLDFPIWMVGMTMIIAPHFPLSASPALNWTILNGVRSAALPLMLAAAAQMPAAFSRCFFVPF